MGLFRSLRLWRFAPMRQRRWLPPPPAPPRTRHDRIIDRIIELVPSATPFRPRDVYPQLANLGLNHAEFDTLLWVEAHKPTARIERLGHGCYRVVAVSCPAALK